MHFDFLKQLKTKLGLFRSLETRLVDEVAVETKFNDQVIKQLHRIRGQLAGVERMYRAERTCTDIVYQIMAVKSSLDTVAKELLTNEVVACSREGKVTEVEKLIGEIIK